MLFYFSSFIFSFDNMVRSDQRIVLTASWEKGLTYVAEGTVTEEEYMQKLDKFVTQKTNIVKQNNFQYQLRLGLGVIQWMH